VRKRKIIMREEGDNGEGVMKKVTEDRKPVFEGLSETVKKFGCF